MPIPVKYQRCLVGLTLVAFGFDPACGAVVSEPPGRVIVGVVSSESSPGANAVGVRDIDRVLGIVTEGARAPFEIRDGVRVAALSYEPSDLITSVDVPKILSDVDIDLYQEIHQLQQAGKWSDADVLIGKLSDQILLGYVHFQRYMHPTAYRSKFEELASWLEDYSDHPDAYRIYRLAMKRRPEGVPEPRRAKRGYLSGYGEKREESDFVFPRPKARDFQPKKVVQLVGKVRSLIGRGRPTAASKVLAQSEAESWLTHAEFDQLRADVGRGFYAFGKDEQALEFAGAAAGRSGKYVPEAYWISGLAAWRLGLLDAARTYFEFLAAAETNEDFLKAGGAYWAARVHEAVGRKGLAKVMLRQAARSPRTLYGLLALNALGEYTPFYWAPLSLRSNDVKGLLQAENVRRAIALVEVGQQGLAEQELRKYFPEADIQLSEAVLRLAVALDLPALQIRIGSLLEEAVSRPYEVALYPVPNWKLKSGYLVDQALLLSIVRQESIFNERARSRRGARGLMQLMPRTATFVDGEHRYHRNGNADLLYEPQLNVELGQRYLSYLLSSEMFDGNLLLSLAAYNSGPATVKKWRKEVDYRDDPLLFVESVPSRETRWFLRRVLTNLGVYRSRLGQAGLSLQSIVAGEWPHHFAMGKTRKVERFAGN
ncbi:MAG TPA: lytic transglycosylase domain-containing protein [Alphaproteobacteria bacterium]|nr:lytic transglycosylase domain-containing protein [Alphaproteobacteria bacterium]